MFLIMFSSSRLKLSVITFYESKIVFFFKKMEVYYILLKKAFINIIFKKIQVIFNKY